MFKTVALTALATALLFGAMPAHADRIFNGGGSNGLVRNGLTSNGGGENGVRKNGAVWNGNGENGMRLNGFKANSVELMGQRDSALTPRVIAVELPTAR